MSVYILNKAFNYLSSKKDFIHHRGILATTMNTHINI